ncbi:UNVERIFIED_CONTAM: hypothetical protein RMT77_003661 [Armadillidium vulgare]
MNTIKEKDLVIVQKGSFFKACRVSVNKPQRFGRNGESQALINLEKGIGHVFGTSFKLVRGSKKCYSLEVHGEESEGFDLDVESGIDNRNIFDDGQSQSLSKSDIKQLVESGVSGDEVIQTLAQNNKTFTSKTKYSQEKYVSKKLRKYDEIITLHRPSMRLLLHMYYSQDPLRISNLRIDTLSQMVAYANVQSGGRYAVYEAGMQGLVSAALLSQIGTLGSLVHIYSGSYPHKEAVELLEFSTEELLTMSFIGADNLPLLHESNIEEETKMENGDLPSVSKDEKVEKINEPELVAVNEKEEIAGSVKGRKFVRSRVEDIKLSTSVLRSGVHGLIVACRQHPSSITLALLPYLLPGHSFVIFSPYKETLMDIFMDLKNENCVNIRLVENWLRNYQVLPQRTHPEVNMSGGGGYLLTGWKVSK